MGQFALDLKKFETKVGARADLLVRKVVLDLLRKVTLRTPVDTGRARANWNVALESPDPRVTEDTDPTGSDAITDAEAVLSRAEAGGKIYITNNLVYIVPLEEGSSSDQAPRGMVAVSLREFPGIVERTAGKVRFEVP